MKFLLTLGLGFAFGVYVHMRMVDKTPLIPESVSNAAMSALPSSAPPAKGPAALGKSVTRAVSSAGVQHL